MLKIRVKHVSAAIVDNTGFRFVKLSVDAIRFAELIYLLRFDSGTHQPELS